MLPPRAGKPFCGFPSSPLVGRTTTLPWNGAKKPRRQTTLLIIAPYFCLARTNEVGVLLFCSHLCEMNLPNLGTTTPPAQSLEEEKHRQVRKVRHSKLDNQEKQDARAEGTEADAGVGGGYLLVFDIDTDFVFVGLVVTAGVSTKTQKKTT